MQPDEIASAFVAHATVLLAVNLVHDLDPTLAGFLPDKVPEADELLDDPVLLGQVLRAPRGEPRLERAITWFDSVWFEQADRAALTPVVRETLDRQRDVPAILDLETALSSAVDLLEPLVTQSSFFRGVADLERVLEAVKRWQGEPTRENLLDVLCLAQAIDEPDTLPTSEVVRQIRFFAQEGTLLAAEYLALHFSPGGLVDWDMNELTDLLRSRYPLMRRSDVVEVVGRLTRR
ncbi:hypothetical protein [Oleisolibacter albus]|uniref:hypothetical protein n=1 Tax=Oleisolibacter albus TaxID=2171757 RepID=UPI000DF1BF0B|nr:hypothetical protein [Oleisolibacter albus]